MSAPPPTYDEYSYAKGSYQQGGGGSPVIGVPSTLVRADEAYARSLQQETGRAALQQNQVITIMTGQHLQSIDGTQYVAMYQPSSVFNPAELGVTGSFVTPHDIRLMEAYALGQTVRTLAILDGLILLINSAWFPLLFLLLLWAPLSGWLAGKHFSTTWTYVYCCYFVVRLSMDVVYFIQGYMYYLFMFVINLIIATYIFRFAKMLNSLTPAEIEQLRNPGAVWIQNPDFRVQQPCTVL